MPSQFEKFLFTLINGDSIFNTSDHISTSFSSMSLDGAVYSFLTFISGSGIDLRSNFPVAVRGRHSSRHKHGKGSCSWVISLLKNSLFRLFQLMCRDIIPQQVFISFLFPGRTIDSFINSCSANWCSISPNSILLPSYLHLMSVPTPMLYIAVRKPSCQIACLYII